MALADLLGSLGADSNAAANVAILPQRPNPYGGYQFDLPAQPAPTAALATAYKPPSKFRNFLGALGDALLVAHGQQPLYRQRMEQQRAQGALQGFLTNPDQAIEQLMQVDPVNAITLYKAVHPASELPVGVKEYEYEQKLDPAQRAAFEKVLQLTHPGMTTPITLPDGATLAVPGAGSALPQVTDQRSYDAVPSGGQYVTPDGKVRVKGGATASTPSQGFSQ